MAKFIVLTSAYTQNDRCIAVNVDHIILVQPSNMQHQAYQGVRTRIELTGGENCTARDLYVQENFSEVMILVAR